MSVWFLTINVSNRVFLEDSLWLQDHFSFGFILRPVKQGLLELTLQQLHKTMRVRVIMDATANGKDKNKHTVWDPCHNLWTKSTIINLPFKELLRFISRVRASSQKLFFLRYEIQTLPPDWHILLLYIISCNARFHGRPSVGERNVLLYFHKNITFILSTQNKLKWISQCLYLCISCSGDIGSKGATCNRYH